MVADGRDVVSDFPTDRGWDVASLLRPRSRRARQVLRQRGRLRRRRRRLRRRLLRDRPQRGARHGPPAAAAPGAVVGGRWNAAGSTRHRCAAARPACSRASSLGGYGMCRRQHRGLPAHRHDVERDLGPGGLRARAWRAPRCRSTPRARRRWWRCTWPCRRCASASATWRWRAASPSMHPDDLRRVQPAARAGRRRPLQAVRRGRRRRRLGRGRRRARRRAALRRPALGHRVLARGPRLGGQPGRRVQRPDRAERPVAAAGGARGAGQCRPVAAPTSTSSRATAPAPRSATPSRRRRCWRPTGRTATQPAVAGLGEVEHGPHPGRRGRRGRHQDDHVDAARAAARDAARRRRPARTSTGPRARWRC